MCNGSCSVRRQSRSTISLVDHLLTEQDPIDRLYVSLGFINQCHILYCDICDWCLDWRNSFTAPKREWLTILVRRIFEPL